MGLLGLSPLILICLSISVIATCTANNQVGVNYGQLGNNLPSPTRAIHLIKTLKAKSVKIYDANPKILKALRNTGIPVCIMLPNELVRNVSLNQTLADQWVHLNVVPFYPQTLIRHLLVGNEILSLWQDNSVWPHLVPAMKIIQRALKVNGVSKVKVGTPSATDVLASLTFPPSNASFRPDVTASVIKPMLQFLSQTKSYFYLDVYTFFPWASDPAHINLKYALLEPGPVTQTDPGSGLTYHNLFDQIVDSVIFAMRKLGYPDIPIWIAETGWPSAGDYDQIGASLRNAATYNRNVLKKFTAGTPARPGVELPGFIFALFNENTKGGPTTERHFGLLWPNGTRVYEIDLTGKTPATGYKPLPPSKNNVAYPGPIWCVVKKAANESEVAEALSEICSEGDNKICDPIRPEGKCFRPNKLAHHASYAFSAYWAKFRKAEKYCYFGGVAAQTIKDPSYGSCKFPAVKV